jgi:hypothetical protein
MGENSPNLATLSRDGISSGNKGPTYLPTNCKSRNNLIILPKLKCWVQRCNVDIQISDSKNVDKNTKNVVFILLLLTGPALGLGESQHNLGLIWSG